MNIQIKGDNLKSRGMILYINRNTRKTNGYFEIDEISEDKKEDHRVKKRDIQ